MALFNKGQEQPTDDKVQRLLAKYGLENIDPQYADAVRNISSELLGTGLMSAGATLGGGSEKDILKIQMHYQKALIEQNFIMIRQLDQIAYLLEQRLQ